MSCSALALASCAPGYESISTKPPAEVANLAGGYTELAQCTLAAVQARRTFVEPFTTRFDSKTRSAAIAQIVQIPDRLGWMMTFSRIDDGRTKAEIRSWQDMWGNALAPADLMDVARACSDRISRHNDKPPRDAGST